MSSSYDWNLPRVAGAPGARPALFDETLRDGLQDPCVAVPDIGQKYEIIERLARLGVEHVNIGYPGAGAKALADAANVARRVERSRLPIALACAARTHPADIEPILTVAQRAGRSIEVMAFVGASALRRKAEGWSAELVLGRVQPAIALARRDGGRCTFVMEDTTRTSPEILSAAWEVAVGEGAAGLCLCDTAGNATPSGVRRLISFARGEVERLGGDLQLDWHGHNDRGLALTNACVAREEGVDRIHGCLLGIGERTGNTSLDLLLLDRLLGDGCQRGLRELRDLVELGSRSLECPIPSKYPVFGSDAFRTATGVHAAAIEKALAQGDVSLADRVYSSVPASIVGNKQRIDIGPMSGASNVRCWLRDRAIEPNKPLCCYLLAAAKQSRRVLQDVEVFDLIERFRRQGAG